MIVHERGCVYNFNFHLVFVTKYRKKVFDSPEKVEEMKELLQKRADMSEIEIQQWKSCMITFICSSRFRQSRGL